MWIEIPLSGQIRRADFIDYEHIILTSMPIQSGMTEKMTSLLLKFAALPGGRWTSSTKLEQQAGASTVLNTIAKARDL
jgi:hypothetical protein